jgi:hypothetical protein
MTPSFKLLLLWLCAALAALVVGLAPVSAAYVNGHFIPVGPDGFYHARRILDAVADPSAFFQFDPYSHVPEGNLITWPWFYDYVMSLLVRLAVALHLVSDPIAALVHIPVLLFTLAPLLVMSICRSLGMTRGLTLLAMLATAFFPMNQAIYSVGNIDHHYCEHLFVLGTLAATLAWLRLPDSRVRAIACGATFGLATGIHSALFILQLPLLGTLVLMWLRRQPLPRHGPACAIALVGTQLAVALPSLPLQLGYFNYYTLSWFQPYVATCTAIVVVLLARLPRNGRGFALLGGVALLLMVPTIRQVLYAGDFFTNSIGRMGDLIEVRSVFQLAKDTSVTFVAENYTWLIVLLPATAALCAWRLWRPRDALQAHFALTALAGLMLLPLQARLQYFGSFALYLPWLLVIGEQWRAPRTRVVAAVAAAVVLVAASFQGLRHRVFSPHVLSEEPNYSATYQMYAPLAARCAAAPGVVLAQSYEGDYLRFHTRCPIIADGFLVTAHDVEKASEVDRLLNLSARELRRIAPDVRYVFVRRATIFLVGPDGNLKFAPGEYPGTPEYPLVRELLNADEGALPAGYELIYEMRQSASEAPFARVLAISPISRAEQPR